MNPLVQPLLLLAFAILLIDRVGYSFVGSAATALVVRIQNALNPADYAGDWFLALPKVYHENFVQTFTTLSRLVPLETLFVLGHVVTVACVLLALWRLRGLLFPDRPHAFLLGVVLLVGWGHMGLGNNPLFATVFVASTLATGIAYLGMAEYVGGHERRAAFLLGLATVFHLLVGGIPMLYLGTVWLFGLHRPGRLREVFIASLCFLAPALLTLWPIIGYRISLPLPNQADEFVRILAYIRNPHHYVPSSWELSLWIEFFFPFLLAVAAWVRARRGTPHRRLLALLAAMAFWCVIGTVFVEWVPQREITQLQLFRLTPFARAVATLAAATYLLGREQEASWPPALLAVLLAVSSGFKLMIPVALLLLASDTLLPRVVRAAALASGAGLAAVGVAGMAGASVPAAVALNASHFSEIALPLALLAGLRFLVRESRWMPSRLAVPVRSGLLAWGALALMVEASVSHAARNGVGAQWRTTVAESVPRALRDWAAVAEWIHRETPPGSLFITPPHLDGFHLLARRPEVADFKSAPFTDAAIVEWKARLEDLAGGRELDCSGFEECIPFLERSYNALDAAELAALGAKYGAWGCVVEREVPGLDVAHREGTTVVYRFRTAPSSSP